MADEIPLAIRNIDKNFNSVEILKDINFNIKQGEIFGLVGLNGVGKTTLIKIILDLLTPDKGEVEFYGQKHNIPESRVNIAYLPEKFYPSQFLKGEEFISLALSYYKKEYEFDKVEDIVNKLDLDPKVLKYKVNKYSKGMSQKLGLSSIFLSEAPLLILDEPMSGLDPKARIQLKKLLIDYTKTDKTIFFTSHILSDIDEICNRIAVLDHGNIIFIGTPEEFRAQQGETNLEKAFLKSIHID
ncbi:MAG: ABC transporter ATP-binding protein [Alphaproteobacteria bacterium]